MYLEEIHQYEEVLKMVVFNSVLNDQSINIGEFLPDTFFGDQFRIPQLQLGCWPLKVWSLFYLQKTLVRIFECSEST